MVAALAMGCLAMPAVAGAQDGAAEDAEARRTFRIAQAHYDNGDFEQAAAGFEEAYRLSGRPQLLYNTFIAYRDAQNLPKAVDALRRYLEEVPDSPDRDQLRVSRGVVVGLATVEPEETDPQGIDTDAMGPVEAAADADEGSAAAPDAPAESGSFETTADTSSAGPPIVALVVGGVGVAMVAGSVVTGLMASSAQSELEEECPSRTACDPALEDTHSRGKTLALVTDILLFGGLAVVGTGVVLWVLTGDSDTESGPGEPVASVGCGPGGCAGSVAVSF